VRLSERQADLSEKWRRSLLWYCGVPTAEFQENIHYCYDELHVLESSYWVRMKSC